MRHFRPFSSLVPLAPVPLAPVPLALVPLVLGLLVAGCGGSGGDSDPGTGSGSPGGSGGSAGTASLFITDSMDDRAHVWVTIKKVVLTSASGDVIAYDDPLGTTVDLKTLRDASGERYSFLSTAPSGTYTGLKITVDRTARVFANGSSSGQERDFAGANGPDATLNLTFAQPRTLTNGSTFTIDFDLGSWTDNGTTLTGAPFLREGLGNGLGNFARHEHEDYHGTVGGLTGTAPNQTFNLSRGGRTVRVVTDASTSLFNSNGTVSPTLINGRRVDVRGAFSASRGALVATSIEIEDGSGVRTPEVRGAVSNINAAAGTFTLTVGGAEGFLPARTAITVVIAPNANFRGRRGTTTTRDEFFAALATNGFAEVEGSYDDATNTFTATKLKVEDDDDNGGNGNGNGGNGGGHEAEFTGPTSNVDATARTFSITARQWEGVSVASGTVVNVVTNGSTEFRGRSGGDNIGAQAFFAALATGQRAEAEGRYDANTKTLTARKVKLED